MHPSPMKEKPARSIDNIKHHFRWADPVIFGAMKNMELEILEVGYGPAGYFPKLCRTIVAQQLGGKAAHAIIARFEDLFPRKKITPEQVMAFSEDMYRAIGMSYAKARYVQNLAEKTLAGELEFKKFPQLPDEEIITELTKVKGIGRWTAEMFLMFTLGREDVFSYGDLGLQNGFAQLYGKRKAKSQKSMEVIIRAWSPYKSYASLTLWHVKDSQA